MSYSRNVSHLLRSDFIVIAPISGSSTRLDLGYFPCTGPASICEIVGLLQDCNLPCGED